MAVTVVFLGPLRDLAGEDSREMAAPLNWLELQTQLGPELSDALAQPRVHIACSGKVLADKTSLYAMDGDEVALLPPVSGG